MARDFLSDQIRTKQVIGSGSQDLPKITIISDAEAPNNDGTIVPGVLNDVGDDVFLFVSGTVGGKDNLIADTVTLFGGDVVISGSLYDGNGDLITGGGDGFPTGSINITGSITHTQGVNIGQAPDNDYTDGLFTDLTENTLLGDVIDRFNEVLGNLAPKPAPNLSKIDARNSNTSYSKSAKLSFGSLNNPQENAGYFSVVKSVTLNSGDPVSDIHFSNVDVNGLYEPELPVDGFHKLGIADKQQTFFGDLNYHVTNDTYSNSIQNYPDKAFNDGDKGILKLYLNNSEIHSVDLSSIADNTSSSLNASGSGFSSITNDNFGKFSNNEEFNLFSHRTASWIVDPSDQVNGLNFVTVVHEVGTDERITTSAQWVNDNNSDPLTVSSSSLSLNTTDPAITSIKQISGVKYFTGASLDYSANIENFYKFIYSDTPVTFSTSENAGSASLNFSSFAIPSINTGASEDHTKTLSITTSSQIGLPNSNRIITSNAVGFGIESNITHPLKSIASVDTIGRIRGILIDNAGDSSTETLENFDDEVHRLIIGDYLNQSDVNTGNYWDKTQTLVSGNPGYEDSLLIHNGKLMSTTNSSIVNGANFSSLDNSPANNVDYSTANIKGTAKFYIRKFTNNTNNTIRDFSYVISGNSEMLEGTTLSDPSNSINISFKIPGKTGWLDAAKDFVYNNTLDSDGGKNGTFIPNTNSNPENYFTFGTQELLDDEHMLIRVRANKLWTGNLESISVDFNDGVANTNIVSLTETDNLLSSNTGVIGNLSFGSSLAKTGFTNVDDTSVSSSVDVNQLYTLTTLNNSQRRGIFTGSELIIATINDDVVGQGNNNNNFANNSWGRGQAHVGELKLEINGVIYPNVTIDLTNISSSGNFLDANTGFKNISAAQVTKDNNGLADYRHFYRTGQIQIDPAHQRDGWNYVRVLHDLGTGTIDETSYVEWVNTSNISPSFNVINTLNLLILLYNNITSGSTPSNDLSGISYFTSAKGTLSLVVNNPYKYIYSNSNSAISFTTQQNANVSSIEITGNGVANSTTNGSSRALPSLDINVSSAAEESITINSEFVYTLSKNIPGSLSTANLRCQFIHPLDTVLSDIIALPNPLIYTVSDSESDTVEDFSAESYRLQSNSHNQQTDLNSNAWDSSESLVGADAGHNDGLQVFDDSLIYPTEDFTSGFANLLVGPSANHDYSNQTGERTFYRKFKNTTANSQFGFEIKIKGSDTTISNNSENSGSYNLSTDEIKVFAKIPNTSNSQATGFMDLAKSFNTGQTSDGDGCLQGVLSDLIVNTGTGTSNNVTFGTKFLSSNDFVIIKIVADSTWSGNLNRIEIVWS